MATQGPGPYGPRGPQTRLAPPPSSPFVVQTAPVPGNPPVSGPPVPSAPINTKTQDPLGGSHPFANRTQTAFVQARLKALGFNVGIDGVAGPQTQSAYKAYIDGVHPNAWAEAYSAHHHTAASHAPVSTVPAGVQPHGNPADTPAPPPLTPDRNPAGITTHAQAPSTAGLIDPASYARSAANGEYDPQIAELARQIADAKRQEGSTEGNIQDWYSRLVGDSKSAADASAADAKTILGGHDTAAAGLIAALGGSSSAAASDAGAQAGIGRTALEGLGLSNAALSRNLGTAYAGEGVTAVGDQHRSYANDLKAALAKSVDLQGQKGNAYQTALQNALVQRTNQEATRASTAKTNLDAQVEAKLGGVQLAQANANLAGTKLSTDINRWRYQQGIKAASAGGGAGSVPEFTKQNPGQLNQLQSNLLNGMLGPKGNFNQDPASAFQKMSSTLSNLSYGKWDPSTNPAARNYVTNIVASRLSAWNAQNPQKKYALKNGQIVRI